MPIGPARSSSARMRAIVDDSGRPWTIQDYLAATLTEGSRGPDRLAGGQPSALAARAPPEGGGRRGRLAVR